MVTGVTPHVGGPIVGPGCPGVLVDGVPVSVMGDTCVCCGPPDMIVQGYPGVMVDGTPVRRTKLYDRSRRYNPDGSDRGCNRHGKTDKTDYDEHSENTVS